MVDKRLEPKKEPENNAVQLQVQPPQVRVRIPEIKIPEIKVPESVVNMDTTAIADAINGLGQALVQIAQQQAAILATIQEHHGVINKAMTNQPDIKVEAPVVKIPPRPRSFSVEMEDEAGDKIYMNIEANSPN